MALDFSKWDKTYNVKAEDVKELDQNNGKKDFVEVPFGKYEVKVAKMELGASKEGNPTLKVQFKVLNGKYKGNSFFMNQVVTKEYSIHKANEFLRSLDSGEEIVWTGSYAEYATLIDNVHEAIDGNLEYAIDYSCNSKGYSEYKIEDVFEVEE